MYTLFSKAESFEAAYQLLSVQNWEIGPGYAARAVRRIAFNAVRLM
jgi:hypothetical protein